MNRHTLPFSKSCKISVLPKIGIEHWFCTSRSVSWNAQRHFFKCKIITIIVGDFQAILSVNLAKYKGVCIKVYGLWSWGLIYASVSLSILRSTIAEMHYAEICNHKSQNFPMITTWRVAKLSTSPNMTIFLHRYHTTSFQIIV